MKLIFLIILCTLCTSSLNAQVKQLTNYDEEKAKATGLKMLVDSLKLTSSQSIALQKTTQDFSASIQSLAAQKLTGQQRQIEIKKLLFLYHKGLGQIFTPVQMAKYKSIEHNQQQKLQTNWDRQQRRGKLRFVEASNN